MHIQALTASLPVALPQQADCPVKPGHTRKHMATMLKLKTLLLASPPHQDKFMLDAFRLRLLPVTFRLWND